MHVVQTSRVYQSDQRWASFIFLAFKLLTFSSLQNRCPCFPFILFLYSCYSSSFVHFSIKFKIKFSIKFKIKLMFITYTSCSPPITLQILSFKEGGLKALSATWKTWIVIKLNCCWCNCVSSSKFSFLDLLINKTHRVATFKGLDLH